MIGKILSLSFLIQMLFAAGWAATLYWAVGIYNTHRQGQLFHPPRDSFKWPLNMTVQVLAFLIPALTGLLGFLYTRDPDASYTFLFSAICLFFFALLLTFWPPFALFGNSAEGEPDLVALQWPEDKILFAALPLTHGLLLLGLVYFALFITFELALPEKKPPQSRDDISVVGTPLCIGQSKERIIELWGAPTRWAGDRVAVYDQGEAEVILVYKDQRLATIISLLKGHYDGS